VPNVNRRIHRRSVGSLDGIIVDSADATVTAVDSVTPEIANTRNRINSDRVTIIILISVQRRGL
jgi:hypothetical protein